MRKVLYAIACERERQVELLAAGKIRYDCADPKVDPQRKLNVLTEEFLEAVREVNDADPDDDQPQRLRTELIQVAAVATAWVESLDTL
jgi:hypothetical protein